MWHFFEELTMMWEYTCDTVKLCSCAEENLLVLLYQYEQDTI